MTRWFKRLPIAKKLRLLITTACVVVVGFTCVALVICEWIAVRQQIVYSLEARCALISANASAAVIFNSPGDAEEILGAIKTDRMLVAGAILRPDGTVFAQYVKPGFTPLSAPQADHPPELSLGFATVWGPMLNKDGHTIGSIGLRMSLAVLYQRFQLYAWTALGVMLIAGIVSYLLSHRLQRIISQPLLDLADAADRVTEEKNFEVRVANRSDDEIGKLAVAFNSMLATIQAGEAESGRLYEQVRAYATGLEARVQERTAQLQTAFNELESFSYSISHDLRGPLRHIGTYTEMILEDGRGKLSADAVAYGERVQVAVKRLEEMVTGLLAFSRTTKEEPKMERVDVGRMCAEVVAELRTEPGNAAAEVMLGELQPARADPLLLRHVLTNLIGNAFKYSRNSRPAKIQIFQAPPESPTQATYAVRDNGVGFNAQAATELFTVFVRLHDSREFEGTGIGLATVKRILLRHGGRVWAESSPGNGATFYFTLPTGDSVPPTATLLPKARIAAPGCKAN